ncbi:alpha/beta hydrolase [Flammeovirga aprica]|uniref:Alpha/beta hydrolase n=1 Tax=Flammeovirga aprica JL-4 TaxID=694437 RepID=A0A7X9RYN6_9BACT|nr:alpha/beta hydrolase [Flammeovirga aprica]NME71207.1 alpha/beta hydrolase [Flammeovirga aprica JL-4]
MKRILLLLIINVSLICSLQAQKISADKVVMYRDLDSLKLNLHIFQPSKKASSNGAVVLIHGGGWNSGSPKALFPQAKHLADRGLIVFLPEYRVRKRNNTTIFEAVEDVQIAMAYVRNHASEYDFDPNKIVVGGGSAGGHLSLSLAFIEPLTKGLKQADYKPNLLVLFNPVMDMSKEGYAHRLVDKEMKALGRTWESFSPRQNINKDFPSMLAMLGDTDKVIPVKVAEDFQAKCQAVGVECQLKVYEGAEHSFFNAGYAKKKGFEKGTINRWHYETIEEMDRFLVSKKYLEGSYKAVIPEGAIYPIPQK